MTAIVTGTDGRSYVHRMAGEVPVFVTGAAGMAAAPPAIIRGHARLVAWLLPVEAGTWRARVRLPSGQIVEVAAAAVCSAANIARIGIGAARRAPAAPLVVSPVVSLGARPQPSLSILPGAGTQGRLADVAAAIGAEKPRAAAGPTAR